MELSVDRVDRQLLFFLASTLSPSLQSLTPALYTTGSPA